MEPLSLSEENQRITNEIAIDLKNRLCEKEITIRELSERSGLNRSVLNAVLAGTNKALSITTVIKIYKALNVRCRFITEVDPCSDPILPQMLPEEKIVEIEHPVPAGGICVPVFDQEGSLLSLEQIEATILKIATDRDSHYTRVAQQLGMGRSTFYRRLEKLGISRQSSKKKKVSSSLL